MAVAALRRGRASIALVSLSWKNQLVHGEWYKAAVTMMASTMMAWFRLDMIVVLGRRVEGALPDLDVYLAA